MTVYPWRRCWDADGLHDLMELATDHAVEPIPNLETELEGALPPEEVARICSQYPVSVVGWSCMGWLQNSVDFSPMTSKPVLLQLFPTDMRRDPADLERIQADCVTHARDHGFRNVGVTYQTYRDAKPEWYDYWSGVRSYYTGDDIKAGNWGEWA